MDQIPFNKVSFELAPSEITTLNEWVNEHNKTCKLGKDNASRSTVPDCKFSFTFRQNSIGVCSVVSCACGEKKDLTDTNLW